MLKSKIQWQTLLVSVLAFAPLCIAQESATTTTSLQESLEDLDVGDRWSYNDWESAKSAAAKSKKPILALFR